MKPNLLKSLLRAYTYLRRGHRATDPRPTYLECAAVVAALRGNGSHDSAGQGKYTMDDFRAETMILFRDTISMEVATDSNVDEDVRQEMETALFELEE